MKIPICHPKELHCGKGLCKKCFDRKRYIENREYFIAKSAKWHKENPEKSREQQRRLRARGYYKTKKWRKYFSEYQKKLYKTGGQWKQQTENKERYAKYMKRRNKRNKKKR